MGHSFNWIFSLPRSRRRKSISSSQPPTEFRTSVPQTFSDHPSHFMTAPHSSTPPAHLSHRTDSTPSPSSSLSAIRYNNSIQQKSELRKSITSNQNVHLPSRPAPTSSATLYDHNYSQQQQQQQQSRVTNDHSDQLKDPSNANRNPLTADLGIKTGTVETILADGAHSVDDENIEDDISHPQSNYLQYPNRPPAKRPLRRHQFKNGLDESPDGSTGVQNKQNNSTNYQDGLLEIPTVPSDGLNALSDSVSQSRSNSSYSHKKHTTNPSVSGEGNYISSKLPLHHQDLSNQSEPYRGKQTSNNLKNNLLEQPSSPSSSGAPSSSRSLLPILQETSATVPKLGSVSLARKTSSAEADRAAPPIFVSQPQRVAHHNPYLHPSQLHGSLESDRYTERSNTSVEESHYGISVETPTDSNKKASNRYHRIFRGGQGRFRFHKSSEPKVQDKPQKTYFDSKTGDFNQKGAPAKGPDFFQRIGVHPHHHPEFVDEAIFGTQQQHEDKQFQASDLRRPGEQALMQFIRKTLGTNAEQLAVRLMNKAPITSSSRFRYVIHQGSEDSDIDIIRRDLTNGRCFANGMRLMAGGWCNLLLGDRFTPGSSPRQRHELVYRRSTCSCLVCMVRAKEAELRAEAQMQAEEEAERQRQMQLMQNRLGGQGGLNNTAIQHGLSASASESASNRTSTEILSHMSTSTRTPVHSAMANFVTRYELPSKSALLSIGGSSSSKELEIGSVIRLNYRTSAKLKFTEDARELFGHMAYTGPISHEEVYRRITTIGVQYYLYNKGKKDRKVYIQGDLIRVPINVGVVKLGTQPMYMPELGATYCLYRKQIMSVYVGELVLEGNSMGSFIRTGIRYYIGFGEERGVCPVYPNKTLGKARKLGVNELLLHHHMVDDVEVDCL